MISRREVIVGAGASAALASCGSKVETKPIPYMPFNLGRGMDDAFGEVLSQVFVAEPKEEEISERDDFNPNKLSYSLIEDQSSYNRIIAKSASASGSYGIYSGNGSISKTTTEDNNSYSLHVMAIATKGNKHKVLPSNGLELNPKFAQFVEENANSPSRHSLLLKEFGDRYISGITSGSELLIDILFETQSIEKKVKLKAEISGAVKGLASGSGGYQKLISSAKSHKNISAKLIGIDSSGVPRDFDKEEIYNQGADIDSR